MHRDGSENEIATIVFENGEFDIEYGRRLTDLIKEHPKEFADLLLYMENLLSDAIRDCDLC